MPPVLTMKAARALGPGSTVTVRAVVLKENRMDAALTTRHRLTLNDLTPGTTYYVEVSSRNTTGTETAAPVPFITPSGKRGRAGGH